MPQDGQLCPHISGIIMLPGEKNPKPVIWNCLREKCHFWMQTQHDNQMHGECVYVIIANCLVLSLNLESQIQDNATEIKKILDEIFTLLPEQNENEQLPTDTNPINPF